MQTLKWERPTYRNRKCRQCGELAITEYCQTEQCEPNWLQAWNPLCGDCHKATLPEGD